VRHLLFTEYHIPSSGEGIGSEKETKKEGRVTPQSFDPRLLATSPILEHSFTSHPGDLLSTSLLCRRGAELLCQRGKV
jgi:hypothetical protein